MTATGVWGGSHRKHSMQIIARLGRALDGGVQLLVVGEISVTHCLAQQSLRWRIA
jgi:hypothetical protein